VNKTPKVVFAAIVVLGLPLAVWAGWRLAGSEPPAASTPSGAGNLGTAPSGATPGHAWTTTPLNPSGTRTATPSASGAPSPPAASPTATAEPTSTATPTAAPEGTAEPTVPPTGPPPSGNPPPPS
jgi:hypothetical protein